MTAATAFTVQDLQLLDHIIGRPGSDEDGGPIPNAVLRDLGELVPCDDVRLVRDRPQPSVARNELVIPIGGPAGGSAWIVFARNDRRPFSHREVLLVALLRPHLAEMCDGAVRRPPEGSHALTQRQLELVRMVARGQTNRQMARSLGIAEGTVRKHLENAYARLGVGNRSAAVERAFGMVSTASTTELFDIGHPVRPGDGRRVGSASVQEDRAAVEDES